jgi:hypothetical protein
MFKKHFATFRENDFLTGHLTVYSTPSLPPPNATLESGFIKVLWSHLGEVPEAEGVDGLKLKN